MNPRRAVVVIMVMNAQRRPGEGARLLLRIIGAGLLIATAAIHLDLYLTGYRTIPTIGWLFLLQVIAAFALGLLVLVTRSRLVAAAGALFALSTLGGYLLTVQFGLFGFREVRTTAGVVAGIIEVLAFAVLAYLAATPNAAPGVAGGPAVAPGGVHSAALDGPDWLTAGVGRVPAVLGAAVISVVALALLGGALAGAGGTSGTGSSSTASSASSSGAGLRTTTVGGVTVLTNAAGRTLYSFAPDTATKSVCNGSCAAYWPPVSGPLKAGAGVTGKLSTITRADGSMQEVYNGHPLYTYIGDTGPGQANGNNLNLNGGLWKVVPVSGS
jgi:predicted lipoprotein with Yx(FWY)xxD motif